LQPASLIATIVQMRAVKLISPVMALAILLTMQPSFAGDPAIGKLKVVEHQCSQCHRPNDFNGETTAALESLIKAINSGKIAHDKKAIRLSATEIADIAAFWTIRTNKR
jgi:mono/diheme cytochrome c family protein